jgi:hypothetical protein
MIKSELFQKIADENPHLYQRDVERIVGTVFDEIEPKISSASVHCCYNIARFSQATDFHTDLIAHGVGLAGLAVALKQCQNIVFLVATFFAQLANLAFQAFFVTAHGTCFGPQVMFAHPFPDKANKQPKNNADKYDQKQRQFDGICDAPTPQINKASNITRQNIERYNVPIGQSQRDQANRQDCQKKIPKISYHEKGPISRSGDRGAACRF